MNVLAEEVAKFREWATHRLSPDYPPDQCLHGAEWECDYPRWQDIYAAVERILDAAVDRCLTAEETELLLYALARDNEDEHIMETFEQFPTLALQLARSSLSYSEEDARWQAAVLLGRLGTPDAIALLKRFVTDDSEYVRRRAGFALREMKVEPDTGGNR
jgi:hypothetical protein